MSRKGLGYIGEESAALYLTDKGYEILGRNVYFGHSEIDILARDGEYAVFCEVKTRRQYPDMPDMYGIPSSAVNAAKKNALIRAAEMYMLDSGEYPGELSPRIDVIEVYVDPMAEEYTVLEIRHFENAVRRNADRKHRYYTGD